MRIRVWIMRIRVRIVRIRVWKMCIRVWISTLAGARASHCMRAYSVTDESPNLEPSPIRVWIMRIRIWIVSIRVWIMRKRAGLIE